MKFQPWEDYKNKAPIEIDVKEPPCKECKHWKPRVKTDGNGNFDGIVLCHSDMYHDFSCFRGKGKP